MHPYEKINAYQRWTRGVSQKYFTNFDWALKKTFVINKSQKIVSLGSCFAQHIAKNLQNHGFSYLITEEPPKDVQGNDYPFYSALYGNIYTLKQASQLIDRAKNNLFQVLNDDYWMDKENNFIDPFRPNIFKNGFKSYEALILERKIHLDKTLKAFSEADVIVLTLGLTEGWVEKDSGYILPVAPGVLYGEYDSKKYEFKNYLYAEGLDDFESFYVTLKSINKNVRIIVTVSPVMLSATFEDQHVWISSCYSKSCLRSIAEEVSNKYEDIYYFPSYEIITNPASSSSYLSSDFRGVTDLGVQSVMNVFFEKFTEQKLINSPLEREKNNNFKAECDEDIIESFIRKTE